MFPIRSVMMLTDHLSINHLVLIIIGARTVNNYKWIATFNVHKLPLRNMMLVSYQEAALSWFDHHYELFIKKLNKLCSTVK